MLISVKPVRLPSNLRYRLVGALRAPQSIPSDWARLTIGAVIVVHQTDTLCSGLQAASAKFDLCGETRIFVVRLGKWRRQCVAAQSTSERVQWALLAYTG